MEIAKFPGGSHPNFIVKVQNLRTLVQLALALP